jgi:penicillin amidase
LQAHDPEFRPAHISRQLEYPGWALLQARPPHLLNAAYDSWQALELTALDEALAPLWLDHTLANDPWGEANRLRIRHPMAAFVAPVDWWLSMPDTPASGDSHMPRVQGRVHGASERYAVAPGREDAAYFHMPVGQAVHPLSPYFGAGHDDWLAGRPTPWLPGPARYTLRLLPP